MTKMFTDERNGVVAPQVLPLAERPLSELTLAAVDVETTGASPAYGDRVIEVGVERWRGGVPVDAFQQLINPRRGLGPGIVALTGITPEMLVDAPPFERQARELLMRLEQADAIVGHNVVFDLGFLSAEFARFGFDLKARLGDKPIFDTVRVARRLYGRGGNGLQSLARRLDCVPTTAHRALADCTTTLQVLGRMLEPIGGWGVTLGEVLDRLRGRVSSWGSERTGNALPLELQEALASGGAVRMRYADATGKITERVIEPQEIRRWRGVTTLVAFCRLRSERRYFKLDRVVSLSIECLDPDAQPSPDVDLCDDVSEAREPVASRADRPTFPQLPGNEATLWG
jgi:DNA polymerase III epsilon subunit family exonuclease